MLQDFPIYAYIPASDVARARRFYEGKLGFQPKKEIAGGVIYEFDGRDRVLSVSDAQRRHFACESGLLAGG